MASRTADGKHTKRFIVLKKEEGADVDYVRSYSIPEHFETKELAQVAIEARGSKNPKITYKVRQK